MVGRRYVHVNERKGRYTVGDSTVGEENYRRKDEDRDTGGKIQGGKWT